MDDDFFVGYWLGKSDNDDDNGSTLDFFILLLKLFFFGYPLGVVSYEIGRMIYDINLIKWGLVAFSVFFIMPLIAKFVYNTVKRIIENLDSFILRLFLGLILFFIISASISYSIAKLGSLFIIHNELLIRIANIYESLLKWLFSS